MTAATCCNCVFYRYETHTHSHTHIYRRQRRHDPTSCRAIYCRIVVVVASAVVAGTVCFCFAAEMATGVQQNMLATAAGSAARVVAITTATAQAIRIRHVAPFEVVGVYVIFILWPKAKRIRNAFSATCNNKKWHTAEQF